LLANRKLLQFDRQCYSESLIKKASNVLAFFSPVERLSSPVVFILFAPDFYQLWQIWLLVTVTVSSIKNQLR
jgi:hypothetical protein